MHQTLEADQGGEDLGCLADLIEGQLREEPGLKNMNPPDPVYWRDLIVAVRQPFRR